MRITLLAIEYIDLNCLNISYYISYIIYHIIIYNANYLGDSIPPCRTPFGMQKCIGIKSY